jgi:methionyl-tRNA formyltransferase
MSAHDIVSAAAVPSTILICGKGRIATHALSYAVHYVASQRLPTRVAACPNTDDKGYDDWQESLGRAASQLGVSRLSLEDAESERDLLLVSLEYDRLIRVDRFASSRLYNIHFSALPAYRGVFTSIWPILNGESEVGVTLHYMDAGADTGAIIARQIVPLPEYTTARQLYDLYLAEGLQLFRDWLPRLISTVPESFVQDERTASSYNRKSLDLRKLEVDLSRNAEQVCRFVRAFTFPEYQLPTLEGRAIKSCTRIPGSTAASAGSALHATPYSTSFATADGQMVEIVWA